jgi:hypothetical protein
LTKATHDSAIKALGIKEKVNYDFLAPCEDLINCKENKEQLQHLDKSKKQTK